ncbi:MAG: rhomboid family intramembrane serine protease [Lentisphaeria bacterium]|nr:rhomboid family intramembrane serine protease [Lentisphaeria bacterium]
MNCLRCGHLLKNKIVKGKLVFQCEHCHSQGVTLSALRGLSSGDQFVNALWYQAKFSAYPLGGICPCCKQKMSLVSVQNPTTKNNVEIDVCTACQFIWFDPGELESIPQKTQENVAPAVRNLPPQSTKKYRASEKRPLLDTDNESAEPDSAWQYLPALLGLPVEKNAPAKTGYPLLTWGTALLCIAVFILSLTDYRNIINSWGYIPAQWTRHGGLTFITSMFLHGGIGHLIGNMYFLLIFGDNVEDLMGRIKYLILILISGLCATLTHTFFDPASTIPCIGASGFISGIIACYAVSFPQVRITFMYRIFLFYRWFAIPAWGAAALWFLYQVAMGFLTAKAAGGGVAYMAHVGGFVPGIAFAIFHRIHAKRQYEKAKRNFILSSHNVKN